MKLPIVLMLIAHPVSGKACLGQQVSNAGTDNPFESNLTGHWTCTEHQRYARSPTTVRWLTDQTTFQNCQKHRPMGSASSFHPNNFICKRWRKVQRANKSHKTARDTIKTKRKIDMGWFRAKGCLKIACVWMDGKNWRGFIITSDVIGILQQSSFIDFHLPCQFTEASVTKIQVFSNRNPSVTSDAYLRIRYPLKWHWDWCLASWLADETANSRAAETQIETGFPDSCKASSLNCKQM